MKSLNILFAGCLVSFLLTSSSVFSQCQSKINLTRKVNCSPGKSNGEIHVQVDSKGSFDLKLIELDSQHERTVEIKSGSSSENYIFKDLSGSFQYKVTVVFRNEEKFLCKNKVVPNIVLTDEE